MNLAARALLTTATASLILLPRLSYGSGHGSHENTGPWETQYTTATAYNGEEDRTRNALLVTHRDSRNRKDAIAELSEYNGIKGAMTAGRYDFTAWNTALQLKAFGGMNNVKDDDYFTGSHFRLGASVAKGVRARAKIGHEQSKINSDADGDNEDIKADFGYGELRFEDKETGGVKRSIELLGGTGSVSGTKSSEHSQERLDEKPYGFQVIGTYGKYGAEAGFTRTAAGATRNFGVFRFASYDPRENKFPTGFLFYRDNPKNETELKILGVYWGNGIDGSWQLVEPALNGISQGMFTRTIAHTNQDISKAARFNDVGKFSRDYEDGTIVVVGADFEQGIGNGLKIGEREIDIHGTLYRQLGIFSNPHVGIALGETTEPSFNTGTYSMENETARYSHLTVSLNMFDEYLGRHGLRLGFFSDLTFRNGNTDNTCGLYINGIKGTSLAGLF